MKLFVFVTYLVVIITVAAIGFLVLFSGCAALGLPKAPPLPETPQQQLFQTLAKTNWLLNLTIVGVGAGFFAFLNGSSKGLQLMGACFIIISVIIGITKYSAVIAAVSMIGAVALVVYSILVKNKALKEVITGVQDAREKVPVLPNLSPTMIKNYITDSLDGVQSATTKAIVRAVKGTL